MAAIPIGGGISDQAAVPACASVFKFLDSAQAPLTVNSKIDRGVLQAKRMDHEVVPC